MRGTIGVLLLLGLCGCLVAPALASVEATYTFVPTPASLGPAGLNHDKYYSWGIDWTKPDNEVISSATLTFHNIYNDPTVPPYELANLLWTDLLNSQAAGVTSGYDSYGWPNLKTTDQYTPQIIAGTAAALPGTPWVDNNDMVPKTVSFSVPEGYFGWLSDGNFGFGVDPDCYYRLTGVDLVIKTAPELPPGLLLAAVPLAGMVVRKFRRR